jgi:uncharacterized membrane protein
MERLPSGRLAGTMLIAATIVTGLVAGLLFGFACAVMPGLRRIDDVAFVEVMQSINRRILNGWFLLCFVGAPLLTVAALAFDVIGDRTRVLPIAAAVLLTALSYLITAAVNVPLNNALNANPVDPARARAMFESRWVRWHIARTLASTAAFGSLVWALTVS